MKRPNGLGSVYKLKGNLRKPWVARRTVGWTDKGYPKYLFIGYYATRKEAMEELAKYNAKPYDKTTTFGSCADAWLSEAEKSVSLSTKRVYHSSAKRCEPIRNIRFSEIRLTDLQPLVDDVSESMGKQIKVYLSKVFEHAIKHEILPPERHELIRYIKLSTEKGNVLKRQNFTSDEVSKVDDPLVLILLYTGLRVGELLSVKAEDIHLDERWLYIPKSKTSAGVRVVPIAEKIVPCFSALPTNISYDKFKSDFRRKYNGHLPHDTRHTFISRMASLTPPVDERIVKAIVGHAGSGVTETVYTHLDLAPLLDAVNRL